MQTLSDAGPVDLLANCPSYVGCVIAVDGRPHRLIVEFDIDRQLLPRPYGWPGPACFGRRRHDEFRGSCRRWAPHATSDQALAIVRRELAGPPELIDDDVAGSAIRLAYADRMRLKITAIGSYDVDRAGRTKRIGCVMEPIAA